MKTNQMFAKFFKKYKKEFQSVLIGKSGVATMIGDLIDCQ